tara:strand:- start:1457 stop:1684 length:228 start_codon:yes stop_codon:yes gene_type:complete
MMAEKEATLQTILLNDVKYDVASFSENAIEQLKGMQMADTEIKNIQIQLALAQTARNAYIHSLQLDLPEPLNDDE